MDEDLERMSREQLIENEGVRFVFDYTENPKLTDELGSLTQPI